MTVAHDFKNQVKHIVSKIGKIRNFESFHFFLSQSVLKTRVTKNKQLIGAQQKQWHSRAEGTKGGIRRSGDRRQTRSPRRGNPGRAKNQTQGTVEDSPPLFFLRANNNVFF